MEKYSILTRCLICIHLLILFSPASGQDRKIDSLHKALSTAKADTVIVKTLLDLSKQYYHAYKTDSALYYAKKANKLAAGLNSKRLLAKSYDVLAYAYELDENHPAVLETSFKLLELYEQLNDKKGIGWANAGIAVAYGNLEDVDQEIFYYKKALQLFKETKDTINELTTANAIGNTYLESNSIDSGMAYFQKGHEIINHDITDHSAQYAFSLYGLGRANYKLGNSDISLPYYHKSIERAKVFNNLWGSVVSEFSYTGIADIYSDRGNRDSALFYYHKALDFTIIKGKGTSQIYRKLAHLYEGINPTTAIHYFKLDQGLQDSLYSSRKNKQVQLITYKEQQRQANLLAIQQEERALRKTNLQYAAIGILIFSMLMLFLMLSRSIIVRAKAIKLGGVVILLITFEFINLLIHPFLGSITHHSPLLMLLIMVLLAALLVPLHHKIEKYMITKLQEKNNKIRLESARKTIAELSEPTNQGN